MLVWLLDSEIVACGSKDLLTDPLGSLVKEISAGAGLGSLVELYPYGTRASAMTKISIPFVYIAAYGYYNDTADRDYVRARELYKRLGRWMQSDPLWPELHPYAYAGNTPMWMVDPTGKLPVCVLPCACAAACVIDMLAVCADWSGFESYRDCLEKVYAELPDWLKFLCEGCITGCIGCLVRNAKPPKEPPHPGGPPKTLPCKPDCTAAIIVKQAACKIPHGCKAGDSCEVLHAKHAAGGACLVAKRNVDRCYRGINWSGADHGGSQAETIGAIRNCQRLLIKKKCFPWGRR